MPHTTAIPTFSNQKLNHTTPMLHYHQGVLLHKMREAEPQLVTFYNQQQLKNEGAQKHFSKNPWPRYYLNAMSTSVTNTREDDEEYSFFILQDDGSQNYRKALG
ncbi:hypothetical protein TNCV_1721551 [Trichonephila clavipes]|nr:hypothetical protein TNCV_1721551 [Trichonephila clavipes]